MRHNGAGVEWAHAICAELKREEDSGVYTDEEWHDCEEWTLEDFDYDESDAEASAAITRRIRGLRNAAATTRSRAEGVNGIRRGAITDNKNNAGYAGGAGTANRHQRGVCGRGGWRSHGEDGCLLCGKVDCDCEEWTD